MAGVVRGGKFEQKMNELSSPNNIAATAKKFAELEKQHGPYSFGKFLKLFIAEPDENADWDNLLEYIPGRSASVLRNHLHQSSPRRRRRWSDGRMSIRPERRQDFRATASHRHSPALPNSSLK